MSMDDDPLASFAAEGNRLAKSRRVGSDATLQSNGAMEGNSGRDPFEGHAKGASKGSFNRGYTGTQTNCDLLADFAA
eukprot:CAMPEP_0115352434 /NCGR_PEP_ID=MMETSP0270-20121206/97503_1 /TAXON_ID=71861 /ORGANISM="Scrippsiella trochoidea, Strain CCMP3099" /LENGTH=76 /DNA_ID=CAMNT_0002774605 /DNA_START=51 /DNA_END=278 /DNA_ORIENTATION=+